MVHFLIHKVIIISIGNTFLSVKCTFDFNSKLIRNEILKNFQNQYFFAHTYLSLASRVKRLVNNAAIFW